MKSWIENDVEGNDHDRIYTNISMCAPVEKLDKS
jgi:hypothetical protein